MQKHRVLMVTEEAEYFIGRHSMGTGVDTVTADNNQAPGLLQNQTLSHRILAPTNKHIIVSVINFFTTSKQTSGGTQPPIKYVSRD
jgi:kynurenine formamidase